MSDTIGVQVGELSTLEARSTRSGHVDTYVDEGSDLIELIFPDGVIHSGSRAFVSVTEVEDGEPVIGGTIVAVHNVTPTAHTLVVRIAVEPNWGRYVRLSFLIAS